MSTYTPDNLSPRELSEMEYTKEQKALDRQHAITIRELELESEQLSASWRAFLKLPLALIFLPVKICLAFAVLVAFAFGRDLPDALWDLLRG
jgi:hypothetical protein